MHMGNRLASEKSPYLLQHARNPVDWFPWGDEAFLTARAEERPIFLSIGYSTCHWCHVMERESFEDPAVARMLNDVFVCIKVDREERPDIDGVYMTVCQMMTGSGGWPLTIFLLPDRRPFFAATYIPKNTAYGRTGLTELVPRIALLWKTRRKDIEETADHAIKSMQNLLAGTGPRGHIGEETIESAYGQLERRFDPDHGGFGPAPKFPSPHNLLFLLRHYKRTGQKKALTMVEKTLLSMRMGGIYDQVGFGFHRYSTDATWLVPHFEKMLYDQALMAMAYGEAYQLTGKPEYEKTLREIFVYVLRDLASSEGAFYSAEDADSEGVEGKFYLWEEVEMVNLLGDEKARMVMDVFGVKAIGNAPGLEVSSGKNILYLPRSLEQTASDREMPVTLLREVVEWARAKLLEARGSRVRPLRDEKILTDWNGLMCAALAKGGQILAEETYIQAARRAVDFILAHLRSPEGRLLHRYCDGEPAIMGHLDDYAFLVWALLELYEATFSTLYLEISLTLTDLQITHFWDEKGGFFFSPEDGEMLPLRQKEIYDGAIPSGNSIAMLNMIRLARLTGRIDLEEKANHLAEAFAQKVEEFPTGHTQLLQAVNFSLGPAYEVILSGDRNSEGMRKMILALNKVYSPNKVVLFLPSDDRESIIRLAPFVRPYSSIEGRATAYVCRETRCELPTTDVHEMIAYLGGHAGSAQA